MGSIPAGTTKKPQFLVVLFKHKAKASHEYKNAMLSLAPLLRQRVSDYKLIILKEDSVQCRAFFCAVLSLCLAFFMLCASIVQIISKTVRK